MSSYPDCYDTIYIHVIENMLCGYTSYIGNNRHQKFIIIHIAGKCSFISLDNSKWIMLRRVVIYLLIVTVIEKTKTQIGLLSQPTKLNINNWTIVNLSTYTCTFLKKLLIHILISSHWCFIHPRNSKVE